MTGSSKCEGCGVPNIGKHTLVRLLNGGLTLCPNCLAEFNGKNPQLISTRAENAALRDALKPFADCVLLLGAPEDGWLAGWLDECPEMPTVADVKRAREVLNRTEAPR